MADVYLDFGTLGVLIIFSIFGFVTRYLEIVSFKKSIPSIFLIVCCFCVLSYSIYIPRATILYSLNKTVYISLFILLGVYFSKTKFR
ncbi:O-antigen polysaccharide polymerase Wzy [Flavobacterium sp. CS20]|nr:O-antigen polysaccharide polymerase Wzy [Flavobacterium sp. CS20]